MEKLYKHPWLIISVIGIITVFFAFQLPKAELDNNNIRFVPENDQARITSHHIDETFGSSLFILVGLERKYGDVFDAAFLNRIREFNSKMEDIEIVGNINSIVSSDYIFAQSDPADQSSGDQNGSGQSTIVVQKLVGDDFTGTPAEIAELKNRLLSWDIYRRALVSDDFTSTQILIPLTITDEQASHPEVIDQFIDIRNIAREMFKGYADVYVTGIPVISATINESMRSDLVTMIPLVVLVVLLILYFSFRNFSGVFLPLLTVAVAVVWSIGAMPLMGIKLSVVSSVLPVILVAVGSSYGIHIVLHYHEAMKGKTGIDRAEHHAVVLSVLREIGKAIFLSAITTMAGFISFCFTSVVPIREFGIFSSFGVLVSFLAAVTLIPSLLIIRGPKKAKRGATADSAIAAAQSEDGATNSKAGAGKSSELIPNFFTRITSHKNAVIFIYTLCVLLSIWGVKKVVIDNIFVEYFKPTTDIYRSDRFIREKFGGSKIVSVVAEADTTEALLAPDSLSAMDKLGTYLEEQVPEVGKVMGFTDLVKRINQVFNADEDPAGLRPSVTRNTASRVSVASGATAASGTAASDATSSGAGGDDFGFGDFGFDSADESVAASPAGSDANAAATSAVQAPPAQKQANMSAGDVVALLQKAASSGRNRSMNAEELVREMEKLINYDGASYYEIPTDPARYGKTTPEELSRLVANYLVLLSGNISSYANDPLTPTSIKTTIQLRTLGDTDTGRAIQSIRQYISDNFPKNIRTIVGGSALVESSLNRLVVQSQISSVIISILVVFLLVALFYRSFTAGVVIIAPLAICILINLAVMGFAGIKLNIGTSMMASLCMSIGIDYTMHFIEGYKRNYLASGGAGDYLAKTFATSGKAILIDSISTGAGFAVLLFSQFVMLQDLGFLIALAMLSSAIVGLTVIPVLLAVIKPKFITKFKERT